MSRIGSTLPILLVLGCVTTGAGPATGASIEGNRLHSRVVTSISHGLRVSALHMSIRPAAGGRLRAHLALTVTNLTATTERRLLRLGPCTSGVTSYPTCPATVSRSVILGPNATGRSTLAATLHRPPAGLDAVQATLATAAHRPPNGYGADAELLLGSRARSGASSGRAYGISFITQGSLTVQRAAWDLPSFTPEEVYMDLRWIGIPPASVATTLTRCAGSMCAPTTLARQIERSNTEQFGLRTTERRTGADRAGLTVVTPNGALLMSAHLPWPR